MIWWRFYTSLEGRVGRLAFILGGIPFALIQNLVLAASPGVLGSLLVIACGWPGLALTVKRYHDLNMSGWWCLLIVCFLPLSVVFAAAGGAGAHGGADGSVLIVSLAILALSICVLWHIVKLVFFAGTPTANDYGHPPRLAQELFGQPDEESGSTASAPAARTAPVAAAEARAQVVTRVARAPARPAGGAPAGFGRRSR